MSAAPIQYDMVKRIILKDWYFQRLALGGYAAAGALALALLGHATEASFYAGTIVLITIMIGIGIHMPLAVVIEERKMQTLPFVMSLPISPRDYAVAKIVASLLALLIPWATLTGGALAVIAFHPALPGGLVPIGAVILTETLVAACLLLTVAMASESHAWTVGVMVSLNLFFQGFLYWVTHIPSIAATMHGRTAVWVPAAVEILLAELAASALLIGLAYRFQSRKTSFI